MTVSNIGNRMMNNYVFTLPKKQVTLNYVLWLEIWF